MGNWQTMTDLIDRGQIDWVRVAGWAMLGLIAFIVVYYMGAFIWFRWKVFQLNRRQRRAAKALALRGDRTWPL